MKYYFDWNLNLLQEVRLIHAISEVGDVVLNRHHLRKIKILKAKFDFKASSGTYDQDLSEKIEIDHKTPETRIGDLSRPLIFPHAIIDECENSWPDGRFTRFCFPGLITLKRKQLLEDWITNVLKAKYRGTIRIFNDAPPKSKILRALYEFLPKPVYSTQIDSLKIYGTIRGRKYPIKAWDQHYFDMLLDSQLVLCPSGNCTWSYRFFESILCGAIPIVEESCQLYDPFIYYTWTDAPEYMHWDEEKALHNLKACRALLSVPLEELRHNLLNV